MVTSGANQAFVNIVLTLVDAEDEVTRLLGYFCTTLG
jgi:aspartate/methionine/tyrosine aminotransferase